MTFRARLVAVAAVAVVVAVLAACAASYFVARSSLYDSADATLTNTAGTINRNKITESGANGIHYQFTAPSGTVISGGGLPVTPAVRATAAGKAPSYFTDITLGGRDYRELVLDNGKTTFDDSRGLPVLTTPVALQVALPLAGVENQLHRLGLILLAVAVVGIAVALLLAWLVGRTALVPLDELTAAVEEVAETTDTSRRLEAGGVDELGRLRRAFNHLLAALDRSQEAQRQLVLDAGHELRTPLTSLRTNLEVVRRLEELPLQDRSVLIDDLLTQMGELTNLVGDLSELARGDQRQMAATVFRLDQLVEDAVAVALTHGRPREVGFTLSAEPTWVRGQRERMTRAVGNLLDNALKWSPEGTVVQVACAAGVVTVQDHGPGISPEDLPHVFDRFYRAPAARALPGSGLGLAIVAQVVSAEGGTVTAGAAPGGGALFAMTLPTVNPLASPPATLDPADG
ncbi:MAG TPA: HAMP domain-containing sensor histidine kinase [Acidimicrobiales bacterium]|nr:HAMP domain-containing sensor histidine kinase [Acidimicrobiales bacterium]